MKRKRDYCLQQKLCVLESLWMDFETIFMRLKMKKIVLALSPLLLASTAFAGSYTDASSDYTPEGTYTDTTSAHHTGPYVGLAIGWTKQATNSSADDDDQQYFGGQGNAGYAFAINDRLLLGPELGWGYYGNLENNGASSTATDLMAASRYYFNDKVDAAVKLGLAYVDGDGDKNTVAMSGLGMGYDLTSNLNANVTYYHLFGDEDDLSKIDSIFAGVTYSF